MVIVFGLLIGLVILFIGLILVFFYTSCPSDTQMSSMVKRILRINPWINRLSSIETAPSLKRSPEDPNLVILRIMLLPYVDRFNRLPTSSENILPNSLLKGNLKLVIRNHYIFKEAVIIDPDHSPNGELKVAIGVFGKCISL